MPLLSREAEGSARRSPATGLFRGAGRKSSVTPGAVLIPTESLLIPGDERPQVSDFSHHGRGFFLPGARSRAQAPLCPAQEELRGPTRRSARGLKIAPSTTALRSDTWLDSLRTFLLNTERNVVAIGSDWLPLESVAAGRGRRALDCLETTGR